MNKDIKEEKLTKVHTIVDLEQEISRLEIRIHDLGIVANDEVSSLIRDGKRLFVKERVPERYQPKEIDITSGELKMLIKNLEEDKNRLNNTLKNYLNDVN